MKTKTRKYLIKIPAIILGILFALLAGFHIWFIQNSKRLLIERVEQQSGGKLKLQIKKLHYNYFSRQMRVTNASFFSADSVNEATAYRFSSPKIIVKLNGLLPFLLHNKLLIDSLRIESPLITVVNLKANEKDTSQNLSRDLSLSYEMGKIYNSIQQALQELQVKKFKLENGTFTVVKKNSKETPTRITNIDIQIDNLNVGSVTEKEKQKILFSENVVANTHHQEITFPNGRHHLKFSRFNINLKNKIVEFDSCTVSGSKTDSTNASFDVFFDKLRLANVDFDALYQTDVIKADTVYCLSPTFTLIADVTKKEKSQSNKPSLEKIIQQLAGDLQIANVIVSNASFDIKTINNGVPNSFSSEKNNFEMKGLQVNQSEEHPVKVEKFAMAIRNYETFIKDSSYRLQFDSVLFRENKIYLSNFLFNKLDQNRVVSQFNIPQFYLGGLSWDGLVFEKKLKANQATLYSPTIRYTFNSKKIKGKKDVFENLAALNDFMDLDYLDIQDGDIELNDGANFKLHLNDATLSVKSSRLLNATDLGGLTNSVTNLHFSKGKIQTNQLSIDLKNVHFINANGRLAGEEIHIHSANAGLKFDAKDALIKKLDVNENTGDIVADGIEWTQGNFYINTSTSSPQKNIPILLLKNFSGNNTHIQLKTKNANLNTQADQFSFTLFEKKGNEKIKLQGFSMVGNQLDASNNEYRLITGHFDIQDEKQSKLEEVNLIHSSPNINLTIQSPSVAFIPNIYSFIHSPISLNQLYIQKPIVEFVLAKPINAEHNSKMNYPFSLVINQATFTQPQISIKNKQDSAHSIFQWNGASNKKDQIQLSDLRIEKDTLTSVKIGNANINISAIEFQQKNKSPFRSKNAEAKLSLQNIEIKRLETGITNWAAYVSTLSAKNLLLDSLGKQKNSLTLKSINISKTQLSSLYFKKLDQIILHNPYTLLQDATGSFQTKQGAFYWSNLFFDKNKQAASLDSLRFTPTLSRDAFMQKQPFQSDYLRFHTGAIGITGFQIDQYIKENKIRLSEIAVANANLYDYRDKHLPRNPKQVTFLPVALIKKFPVELNIEKIRFTNGAVTYAEVNEKTGGEGIVLITKMLVEISNLKNTLLKQNDSLLINASGSLMDSIHTVLQLNQSYIDSAEGFSLQAKMQPADATIMNPVLVTLASARLRSGWLDSLGLSATGTKDIAIGDIHLNYKNLKIDILDKNGKKRWLLTLLANTFIKNNNHSRKGTIFYQRNEKRSIFNYIVKIAISGLADNTGIQKNKKKIKAQKRRRKN